MRNPGQPTPTAPPKASGRASVAAFSPISTQPDLAGMDALPRRASFRSASAAPRGNFRTLMARQGEPSQAAAPLRTAVRAAAAHLVADQTLARAQSQVQYSDEQRAIIDEQAPIVVANAFAGTGKTTTAVGYAAARPQERLLYVAFNKGIQLEAARRFGPNTRCQTTHSLAWQSVGRSYGDRINRSWRVLNVLNDSGVQTFRQAAIAHSMLKKFFQSADTTITIKHASEAEDSFRARDDEIHDGAIAARKVWERMLDRSDKATLPDDAYLKIWALGNPKLNYDAIIFDEAQDANPVTAAVVSAQTHAKLLYIGDRHQSIYGFRGASNAMDDFGDRACQLHLSKTWRFGPAIAAHANALLREFKGEKVAITGMAADGRYKQDAQVTKLSRTNAQLFLDAAALQGKGIHWIGGIESYQINKLLDAYRLFAGQRGEIQDQFLRYFSDWGAMLDYTEQSQDPETRILAKLIDQYRHDTPTLVADLRSNAVADSAAASLVLTTAHKSKGLDWDHVEIAEDFEVLAKTEAALAKDPLAPIPEQEINLLYVAVTRARQSIQLNEETRDWLQHLGQHQINRQLAERHSQIEVTRMRSPMGA